MFGKDSKAKRWGFLSEKAVAVDLFESLPDAAVIAQPNGTISVANAAARKLFGYEESHWGDLSVKNLFGDDAGAEACSKVAALGHGESLTFEVECLRESAVAFPAEIHVSYGMLGRRRVHIIVFRNITHHRRAVRSLREGEELTRAILTSALDAVVSIDERGIVREFNPAAEDLFGYSREEAIGKLMADLLIPAGKRDAHRAGFQRYLREGNSTILGKRIEMSALKRDGSELPVEIRVSEVRRGQARIFTAYLSDISERLEALSAIGDERDKLEAILSATSDGIVLVDPSGFVRYANKSFEDIFGISAQAIERVHVRDLVCRLEKLAPLPVDAFAKILAAEGPGSGRDRRSERCSVSLPLERSLQVSRKPVGSDLAEQGSWLVVFHDISRDEEIRRAKDDLVGNVSHELRTPLTAIRGFVQLMLDERVGDLSEQQRKFLDVIDGNVDRLMQLVSDLLDVDRVERVPLRADDVDAESLITEASSSEAGRAEAKGLELVTDVEAGLRLVGDQERLLQMLQHLISNAVKYTKEGSVRTTARASESGMALIEVADTGIGMSVDEQQAAYDRFFRSGDSYVREAGGTGLGLSIVRTLVERHGGSIELDSEPGRGSTFRILLPCDPQAVSLASAVPSESPVVAAGPVGPVPGNDEPLVLMIEDSSSVRDVLVEGLQLEGLRVVAAPTAKRALSLVSEITPDVILQDITLPDMDGWELLSTLRQHPRLGHTIIVVLSGHDEPAKALRYGADRFIIKPVDVFKLSEEIRRLLARKSVALESVGV